MQGIFTIKPKKWLKSWMAIAAAFLIAWMLMSPVALAEGKDAEQPTIDANEEVSLTIAPVHALASDLALHRNSTVAIAASDSAGSLDPFNRDGDPGNVGLEFRPPVPLENCFWVTTVSLDHFYNSYCRDR